MRTATFVIPHPNHVWETEGHCTISNSPLLKIELEQGEPKQHGDFDIEFVDENTGVMVNHCETGEAMYYNYRDHIRFEGPVWIQEAREEFLEKVKNEENLGTRSIGEWYNFLLEK